MIVTITTKHHERVRSYTGHVVSRTHFSLTLLVTEPYPMAGQSVEIDTQDIVSERVLVR